MLSRRQPLLRRTIKQHKQRPLGLLGKAGQTQAIDGRGIGATCRCQRTPHFMDDPRFESERCGAPQGIGLLELRLKHGEIVGQSHCCRRKLIGQPCQLGGNAPQGALIEPATRRQRRVEQNQPFTLGKRRRDIREIGGQRPATQRVELWQQQRPASDTRQHRAQFGRQRQRRNEDEMLREIGKFVGGAGQQRYRRRIQGALTRRQRMDSNRHARVQRSSWSRLSGTPFWASASGNGSLRSAIIGQTLARSALRAMKAR